MSEEESYLGSLAESKVAPFIGQLFPFYNWIHAPFVMLPANVAMIQLPIFLDSILNKSDAKCVSMMTDKRRESTLRVCQSTTAVRYIKPFAIGK